MKNTPLLLIPMFCLGLLVVGCSDSSTELAGPDGSQVMVFNVAGMT